MHASSVIPTLYYIKFTWQETDRFRPEALRGHKAGFKWDNREKERSPVRRGDRASFSEADINYEGAEKGCSEPVLDNAWFKAYLHPSHFKAIAQAWQEAYRTKFYGFSDIIF